MIKIIFKILLLLTLCIPVIYLEYYILKNTAKEIKPNKKRIKDAETLKYHGSKHYKNKYLEAAK